MAARLALFDLDNTLLAGDSDHAWGEFLIAEKLVDGTSHRAQNDAFYEDYLKGQLDIHAYVQFTIAPLLDYSATERAALHERFMAHSIMPLMQDKAATLLQSHRQSGDCCAIVTATNSFITAPIAKALGINNLLATDLEVVADKLTGKIMGTPCYQEGKVARVEQWLSDQPQSWSLAEACFYSDSINDLPLLEAVGEPVVVDADEQLLEIARERHWRSLSLRS